MHDIKALMEAVATRVQGVAAINVCHARRPNRLGKLPEAIIGYLPSPVRTSSHRLRVDHRLRIEVIVAPFSDLEGAVSRVTDIIQDVMTQIHSGIVLTVGAGSVVMNIVSIDVPLTNPPRWGGISYVAAHVEISCTDVSGETFSP